MNREQEKAMHARLGNGNGSENTESRKNMMEGMKVARTPYDRDYNREYNNYNSGAYAEEEILKNEGMIDASDTPSVKLLKEHFPRHHHSVGRHGHHRTGTVSFQHEDKSSRSPLKNEIKKEKAVINKLLKGSPPTRYQKQLGIAGISTPDIMKEKI